MEINSTIIPIRSLSNGDHDFTFRVGKDNLALLEEPLFNDGSLQVELHVHKMDQLAHFDFFISGSIKAQCDICLGIFDYPIEDCEGRITLRFGDHFEEVNEELYEVDEAEEDIDVLQWVYELVCVTLPIRFEHPLSDDGESTCDPEQLAELDKYLVDESEEIGRGHVQDDGETDPRWDALRQLLDGNK